MCYINGHNWGNKNEGVPSVRGRNQFVIPAKGNTGHRVKPMIPLQVDSHIDGEATGGVKYLSRRLV